ncbi:hypothetical protein QOT17_25659 [Balamuthia mandrillaris]
MLQVQLEEHILKIATGGYLGKFALLQAFAVGKHVLDCLVLIVRFQKLGYLGLVVEERRRRCCYRCCNGRGISGRLLPVLRDDGATLHATRNKPILFFCEFYS